MPRNIHYSTPVTLQLDGPGSDKVFKLRTDSDLAAGMVVVDVFDGAGNLLGTPIRFKLSNSGGRVAADLPGVDPSSFITEDGHITNG